MIEPLFHTPIYCHIPKFSEVFLVQDEIKKKWDTIKESDTWDKPGGWEEDVQTNIGHRWNSIRDHELNNLDAYIKLHTQTYIDSIDPFMNNDVFLSHSWFNVTTKGQSQEWHAHTDSFISGVYYYKTNKEDGDLMIRNPVPFTQRGFFPAGKTCPEKVFYKPIEGMIILFPGWLEHRVGVNTTDNDRITIAFNWLTVNEDKKGLINERKN
jgi:uncharacterized protein (TIGR02466 family)